MMKKAITFLLCFLAIVSCAAIPPSQIASENAGTWVGAHIDDAMILLGPPVARQNLSNGGTVVMWQGTESYQSGGVPTIAPSIGFGGSGQYLGSTYSITHTPATTQTDHCKLIMAFEPNGIITSSRSQGGCEVPKFSGSKRTVYRQPVFEEKATQVAPTTRTKTAVASPAAEVQKVQKLTAKAAPANPLEYVRGKWKITMYTEAGRCDSSWTTTMEFLGTREGVRHYTGGSVFVKVLDDGSIKLKHGGNANTEYKIYDGYLSPNGFGEGIWRVEAMYSQWFCRGRWKAKKIESY